MYLIIHCKMVYLSQYDITLVVEVGGFAVFCSETLTLLSGFDPFLQRHSGSPPAWSPKSSTASPGDAALEGVRRRCHRRGSLANSPKGMESSCP